MAARKNGIGFEMSDSKLVEKAQDIAGKTFDKLQEGTAPLTTALSQRFGSPLFYSFMVSWAFMNWDRLAILFLGTGGIEERILSARAIDSVLLGYDHALTYYLPAIATIILVVGSPYINNAIDWLHKKAFRTKYIHSAALEAEKYTAQSTSITEKIAYERAEQSEILRIDALDAEKISRRKIAELDLKSAQDKLNEINSRIAGSESYLQRVKDEIHKINKEIIAAQENQTDISSIITNAHDQVASLNKEIASRRNTIDELRQQEDILRAELDGLEFKKSIADRAHTRADLNV